MAVNESLGKKPFIIKLVWGIVVIFCCDVRQHDLTPFVQFRAKETFQEPHKCKIYLLSDKIV